MQTKAIQVDVDIFTHILAYSDICKCKQAYSPAYSEPSVTQAYLEPLYIQNPSIFRTQSHIYDGAFSRKKSTATIIFITSAFQVLSFMKKILFFNTGLICIYSM